LLAVVTQTRAVSGQDLKNGSGIQTLQGHGDVFLKWLVPEGGSVVGEIGGNQQKSFVIAQLFESHGSRNSLFLIQLGNQQRDNGRSVPGPQSLQERQLNFHGMFRAVGIISHDEGRALRKPAHSFLVHLYSAQRGLKSIFPRQANFLQGKAMTGGQNDDALREKRRQKTIQFTRHGATVCIPRMGDNCQKWAASRQIGGIAAGEKPINLSCQISFSRGVPGTA